uniref:Uncharacterized protein n=1 Tax=Cacopsylla melanoneura TaxID=428564 RepID=A0A8D8RZ38_9HEMI
MKYSTIVTKSITGKKIMLNRTILMILTTHLTVKVQWSLGLKSKRKRLATKMMLILANLTLVKIKSLKKAHKNVLKPSPLKLGVLQDNPMVPFSRPKVETPAKVRATNPSRWRDIPSLTSRAVLIFHGKRASLV